MKHQLTKYWASCRKKQLASLAGLFPLLVMLGCSTPAERLHQAASVGDVKKAAKVLQSGYSPKDAGSPFITAAYGGHTEVVKLLLDAGVDVNTGQRTALAAAARNGHLETVRLLVESGADVNRQENAYGVRDLHMISDNGLNVAQFRKALLKGEGHNALSLAIINRRRTIVEYLLKHGADPGRRIVSDNPKVYTTFDGDSLHPYFPNFSERIAPNDFTEMRTEANGDQQIKTTRKFDREKFATMKELADMSGDREIIALLSVATQAKQ